MKRNRQKVFSMKCFDHSHLCHMTICELADMGADFNTLLIQSKKWNPTIHVHSAIWKKNTKSAQSLNI